MVSQYPHSITINNVADAMRVDGDWIPGAETPKTYSCRAEPPNGVGAGAGKARVTDGAVTDYTWMVYMLPTTDIIKEGSQVVLQRNGEEFEETVKRFISGTFNVQIWL